jgi:hypothetical protein
MTAKKSNINRDVKILEDCISCTHGEGEGKAMTAKKEVVRLFWIGDHVKVIAPPFEGVQGTVYAVELSGTAQVRIDPPPQRAEWQGPGFSGGFGACITVDPERMRIA